MTPDGQKIKVAVCDDHDLFRRGVAEMLGGTLRVDSEPGAGTRVEPRVPLDVRR